MRTLKKHPKPPILAENEAEWKRSYLDRLQEGKGPSRPWAHPLIKTALSEETTRRCAYCDSALGSTTSGDIEHILPRKHRPELVVEWANLTLACQQCNRNKSDYYSAELPLVNPYEDSPHQHLVYFGPIVHARPESHRGRLTIERLKLCRMGLAERRGERIQTIEGILRDLAKAPHELKPLILNILREDIENGEYRATVESFLRAIDFNLDQFATAGTNR